MFTEKEYIPSDAQCENGEYGAHNSGTYTEYGAA